MTRAYRIAAFTLAAAVAPLCRPVAAESIMIPVGGVGFSFDSPPGLGLFGEGFSVTSFFPSVGSTSVFQCGYPDTCPPGTALDLTTVFGGEGGNFSLGNGGATVDGVAYGDHASEEQIELRGTLTFDSSTVIVPTATDGAIFLTAPVVMHGQIAGFLAGGFEPLFERTVHGTGTVGLRLFGVDGFLPPYTFSEIGYSLSRDPVPEPATMLLVGTALAGLGVRRATSGRSRGRTRAGITRST
jgi:hypothetical protein